MKVSGKIALVVLALSFVLGLYSENHSPIYVGNVGTVFDQELLESLLHKLKELATEAEPFD